MHISSLPSPCGIGTMGQAAYEFIDFLARAGQSFWQILPIGPTSYGDSPYQSFSTFAGNPYLIDLDELKKEGWLLAGEYENCGWGEEITRTDYGVLYQKRYPVLRRAVKRMMEHPPEEYRQFCRSQADWLGDYALFMTLKSQEGGSAWYEWDMPWKTRDTEALRQAEETWREEVVFWKAVQYLFFRQWNQLRRYAEEKGIQIIGDLPIYVSYDSVDVWSHPELFQLDGELRPLAVAGCPPDGFSADGQLWGNPLFDWKAMAADGYDWWIRRIEHQCRVYHVLRIDHFRGFDSYYSIPFGAPDASGGHWEEGPGFALFRALNDKIGRQHIIAEDLGFLTDSVRKLLADCGFPGMKVMEFAFDSKASDNAEYLPHSYPRHCIAYIGTHDNETAKGWLESLSPEDFRYARDYLRLSDNRQNHYWEMLQALWATAADITIVQAQDLLGLGAEARMNVPSTTGGNWCWRAEPGAFDDALADRIRYSCDLYCRC